MSWAVVLGAALVLMGSFLFVYRLHHLRVPIGWDLMDYVWRTRLAQDVGIFNLRSGVPPGTFLKEGRPAFLVVASTVSSLTGAEVLRLAMVIPSVMAAALGLAAGALTRVGRGLPWWGSGYAALMVGGSINSVLMMQYGYVDNLMVTVVAVAAGLAVVAAIEHRRGVLAGILLLGAAAVIETPFFAVIALMVGAIALIHLPGSWRAWRSNDTGVLDTPTGRLGQVLAGSAVVAVAMVSGVLSKGASPRLHRAELAKKLRADLPRYGFPVTVPLAALGAGTEFTANRRRRTVLMYLLVWAGTAAVGLLLFAATPLPIPANRLLLFAVAVPVLAVFGVFWLAERAGRWAGTRLATRAQAAVLLVALAGAGLFAGARWLRSPSYLDPVKLEDAAVAEGYLSGAGVPADRPVVFIVDDRGPTPVASVTLMKDHVYAVLPTERLANVYMYVGSPETFLAMQPDLSGDRLHRSASQRYFRRMSEVYARDPVALIVSSFNVTYYAEWVSANPDLLIPGHGVAVVGGPQPSTSVVPVPVPSGEPSRLTLAAVSLGVFVVLVGVGLGWSLLLFGRWFEHLDVLAVAPAVGLAVLVVGGVVADRLGLRLSGAVGAAVPVVLAAGGFGLHSLGRLSRRAPPGSPDRADP